MVLLENRLTNAQNRAKKILKANIGDGWREVYINLKREFIYLRNNHIGCKFFPGIVRLYLDNQLSELSKKQLFDKIILYIIFNHYDDYDHDLNNESVDTLIEKYSQIIKIQQDKDKKILKKTYKDKTSLTNNYKVIKIKSYEDAKKYSKYTNWCITNNYTDYNRYTAWGENQYYFCLKDGFENIKKQKGKNCPLDEYGLSMIAVGVDGDGNMFTSSCRWGYEHRADDLLLSPTQISKLIGVNFYSIFKPSNVWKNKINTFKDTLKNLNVPIEKSTLDIIFKLGNMFAVNIGGDKYNFITNDKKIVFDIWFDRIYRPENNICRVIKFPDNTQRYYNFVTSKGKLLSKTWFTHATCFLNGSANITLKDGRRGEIDINGIITLNDGEKINNITEETNIKQKKTLNVLFETPGAIRRARIMLKKKYGNKWRSAEQVLRGYFPSFLNNNAKGCKFYPGLVRFYFNDDYTEDNIRELNKTLKFIVRDHYNDYDENLNGSSVVDIIDRFKFIVTKDLNSDMEKCKEISQNLKPNKEYVVVKIDSFEDDADRYAPYTTWCVLDDEDTFDEYSENGFSHFYIILKRGFENIESIKGKNYPYDEYGMSMIGIHVNVPNENGNATIKTCTSRWNDGDSYLTPTQITKLLGRNFYDVFKPNMSWLNRIAETNYLLTNTNMRIEDIFECVEFLTKNKNLASVQVGYKYNVVNCTNRTLLFNTWFDDVEEYDYSKGILMVKTNGQYNLVNQKQGLLFNIWVDRIGNDNDFGLYMVYLKDKGFNFIDVKTRNVTSSIWFDETSEFNDSFSRVWLKGKANLVNYKGEIIFNTWYEYIDISDYDEYKIFIIKLHNKGYNIININNKILSPEWFKYICGFSHGFARVLNKHGTKYNFINTNGELLSKTWFDSVAHNFNKNGFADVSINKDKYYLYSNGDLKQIENNINETLIYNITNYYLGGYPPK